MKDIEIIYEDRDIAVVVKPAGMASQPDRSLGMDAVNRLRNLGFAGKGKAPDIMVVHRLDRPVGGVMVYAKNSRAAAALSRQVRSGGMYKEYLAVLTGVPSAPASEPDAKTGMVRLEDYIAPDKGKNLSRVAGSKTAGAVKAVLEYAVLDERFCEDGSRISLVKIHLITGRHHQIRLQMAHAGAGVYGDTKYNPRFSAGGSYKLALFAHTLSFDHPSTGRRLEFTAPVSDAISDHFPQADGQGGPK